MNGVNERRRRWLGLKVQELGLPQERIAAAVGKSRETFNSYLKGRASIPRDIIIIFELMDMMTVENRIKYIEELENLESRMANF